MSNTTNVTAAQPNRTYKARLFEMIFSEKKELLGLYNAVNKTNYTNPELLEINTLENAIYLSMHNDVSFIIDSRLSLYEHQSTYSPNLPLRFLMYVSDLYSALTKDCNLYGKKIVQIAPPKFIVFYNGAEEQPESQEMTLSNMFAVADDSPSLELKAEFLNINPGNNKDILDACKTLADYSKFTNSVRNYAVTMELEEAVEKAIKECIQNGILAEFLTKHRAEAKKVSIYEYDEERQRQFDKEEGREEGREEGLRQINSLNKILAEQNRIADIIAAANDPEYQKKLFEEFGL